MSATPLYPYQSGDFTVIGPECFTDGTVIAYKGQNYTAQPRTITTVEEANELPDRSAILTPGQIIFRKWDDYYGKGKHAWERELGQAVPAEDLDDDCHFPATVLYSPGES